MVSQIKVNEIIKQSGSSISIGESGDTVSIPSGATFSIAGSNYTAGITVADLWLLTSSFQGDASTISSNFSKAVSVTSNVTTESSGIFSFPLTGFYMVTWNVVIRLDSGMKKVIGIQDLQQTILPTTFFLLP
jgi:hypothetical protein